MIVGYLQNHYKSHHKEIEYPTNARPKIKCTGSECALCSRDSRSSKDIAISNELVDQESAMLEEEVKESAVPGEEEEVKESAKHQPEISQSSPPVKELV